MIATQASIKDMKMRSHRAIHRFQERESRDLQSGSKSIIRTKSDVKITLFFVVQVIEIFKLAACC